MIGRVLLVGAALVAGLELSRPGWLAGVALPRLRGLLRGTITIESVTDDNPDTADVDEPSTPSSWEDWW